MTKILFILTFCICAISLNAAHHPIHATVTTIEYNAKTKAFELAVKIFADDLEEAVKRATGTQLLLGSPKEVKNSNALLEQFLHKNIRLEQGNTPLQQWKFIGKELEGEAVWCYVEIPANEITKRLMVQNTVLTDVYDDQTNLVNVQIGSTRRSTLLRKAKPSDVLEFPQ